MAICQLGRCHNDAGGSVYTVLVTVTTKRDMDRERNRFCCHTHAALWLLGRARRAHGEPVDEIGGSPDGI